VHCVQIVHAVYCVQAGNYAQVVHCVQAVHAVNCGGNALCTGTASK